MKETDKGKARVRQAKKKKQKKIVVTIDGARYRNLERVAAAMNAVSWSKGNTAESVFKEFVWCWVDDELHAPWQICDCILSTISTGDGGSNAPAPMHKKRIAELAAAFHEFSPSNG